MQLRHFCCKKFMIMRFSIAFEDLLASSIAPQVMPPWNESKLTCNDSWWYKNSVWKRSRGHKKLVSSGAFENIAHGAWSYKIYVWKKRSRGHKKLASSGAQRADRRGRQLKSSGMMNSNCLVDAAIFHRTGSAKVVADFPRWWNCNIFMWRHTRGSISNLLHDYYKECCAAVI